SQPTHFYTVRGGVNGKVRARVAPSGPPHSVEKEPGCFRRIIESGPRDELSRGGMSSHDGGSSWDFDPEVGGVSTLPAEFFYSCPLQLRENSSLLWHAACAPRFHYFGGCARNEIFPRRSGNDSWRKNCDEKMTTRRDIFKMAAVMGLSHLLKGSSMAEDKKDQGSIPSSGLAIPDSLLAKDATSILREYSTDLLFNHSMRVYLFAAEQGRQQKLRFDPEILYVAAAFHDLGLTKKFSSPDERFEVDGANAVRQFLTAHKVPEEQVQTAWQAIALHTTPGVTRYLRPEVALLYSAVGLDVLGKGLDQFPSRLRD